MYEQEKAAYIEQYRALAPQLYQIAVLVTGRPDLCVHAVENAVIECFRSPDRAPFSDKIYRFLWQACDSLEPLWGYHYRKNLCAMQGIDVDAGCPAFLDAMSKREKEERMALALLTIAGRTPAQVGPIFEASEHEVKRSIKKICKQMHYNVLS